MEIRPARRADPVRRRPRRSRPARLRRLYWTFSSVSATEVVLLNDLYVAPEHRGAGVGEALVAAAVCVGSDRGAAFVRWMTTLGNRRAQRLYERLGAECSSWFEYEIAPWRRAVRTRSVRAWKA